MAEKEFDQVGSIVKSGEATSSYLPSATPVLDDDGNAIAFGPDALEHQRAQLQKAEEAKKEAEAHPEKAQDAAEEKELKDESSRKAGKEGTSTKEALDKLHKQKEEDAKLEKAKADSKK